MGVDGHITPWVAGQEARLLRKMLFQIIGSQVKLVVMFILFFLSILFKA